MATQSFLLLPAELWDAIFIHLSLEELKSFSLCSSYHRNLAMPTLFRCIKLYEPTIQEFKHGKLRKWGDCVREVSFTQLLDPSVVPEGRGDTDYESILTTPRRHMTIEIIELAALFCKSLGVFPNINGLHICYTSICELEWPILRAILRSIAVYPFFSTLKKLSVDCKILESSKPFYLRPERVYPSLSREGIKFIGGHQAHEKREYYRVKNIPMPRFHSEASISLKRDSSRPMSISVQEIPGVEIAAPWLFFLDSTITLRKLKLEIRQRGPPLFSIPPHFTCPNIQDLWLCGTNDYHSPLSYKLEKYLPECFPNVRQLRIDVRMGQYLWPIYPNILSLPFLTRARLLWPGERPRYKLLQDARDILAKRQKEIEEDPLEYIDFFYNYEFVEERLAKGCVWERKTLRPGGTEICRISAGRDKCEWYTEEGGVRTKRDLRGILNSPYARWTNVRYKKVALRKEKKMDRKLNKMLHKSEKIPENQIEPAIELTDLFGILSLEGSQAVI